MSTSPRPAFRTPKRRLFLVEDHPVTREGFARLLNFEPDLEVCGQAGTASEALAVVKSLNPDLVIVDISLAGRSGLELLKDLAHLHPRLLMLVLSTHDEGMYAERSLRAGAHGYIMKSASISQILEAIRRVLSGKTYLSDRMNQVLHSRLIEDGAARLPSGVDRLSDRELEIFKLIGQGQTTAQIAGALDISPNTVSTHRAHIREKLGIQSLNELVCRAAQWAQKQA